MFEAPLGGVRFRQRFRRGTDAREKAMLAVIQALVQELGLIAKVLGLLSEAVESERARSVLLNLVETIGRAEQHVVDLEFLIRSKGIELESCHRELSRLREAAMVESDSLGGFRSSGSPVA